MKRSIIDYCKKQIKIQPAVLLAIIATETPGYGFDPQTGRLLIQFEPSYFKRYAPRATQKNKDGSLTIWAANKVEGQQGEWRAFNDAFGRNPVAAMLSTSIGLPQIMGDNYRTMGYLNVGAMWDDAKKGEDQQIDMLIKFILASKDLSQAVLDHDWDSFAVHYNGAGYKALAAKLGREPYNVTLENNYNKFIKI